MASGPRIRRPFFCLAAAACFGLPIGVVAQEPTPSFPAAERWLVADEAPRQVLEDALKELLAKPEAGFVWLVAQRAAAGEGALPRRRAVESLITHVIVDFLRVQRASGITFVGQYAALERLQPLAGELLFGLLLETPQWFPHTHRARLVPPLRDLFARAPDEARMAQVTAVVDSSIEPEGLRRALACMLWQWGDQRAARARIDALRQASTEGEAEDRVRTLLDLASLQNELREYRAASGTHRSLQVLAAKSGVVLRPTDLYASACSHALAGDVENGILALQQCAARLSSPDLDTSHKLERTLWEKDPEIADLRRDERYAAIFAQAFGSKEPGEAQRR